ncbi:MAG: hypothetical protein H7329_14360 [Opitutaceae bacterium]|nr:hypothetical protein [Cytophagales bacterium]
MKTGKAIGSGLLGALAVSLVHESLRRFLPKAPRMDKLGMQAISVILEKAGHTPPSENELYLIAMVGDIISNGIYYSIAGSDSSKKTIIKGALLGAAAGVGAIVLPGPLGLNKEYSNKTMQTKSITFGLYLFGGILTSVLMNKMNKR